MPRAKREVKSDAIKCRVDVSRDGKAPDWLIAGRLKSLAFKENKRRKRIGLALLSRSELKLLRVKVDASAKTDISLDASLLAALHVLAPGTPKTPPNDGDSISDVRELVEAVAKEAAWCDELARRGLSRAVQARLVQVIAELAGAEPRSLREAESLFQGRSWTLLSKRRHSARVRSHETCALRRTLEKFSEPPATTGLVRL